jgi:F-type H+-transporting ATPase subunit b
MATETTSAEAVSAPGMPQLDFSTWSNQIFWLVLALIAIYLILSRIALPRIGAVLAERSGTITNDIAAAEDLKAKAVAAEQAYDKALIDARAEAGVIVANAKADIKADLDVAIAKADADIAKKAAESAKAIEEIRASSMANVEIVANDTANEIITAMGGKADAKTVTAAITARMKG